jgi:hypothetical protein
MISPDTEDLGDKAARAQAVLDQKLAKIKEEHPERFFKQSTRAHIPHPSEPLNLHHPAETGADPDERVAGNK